jgi:hypothetical protein
MTSLGIINKADPVMALKPIEGRRVSSHYVHCFQQQVYSQEFYGGQSIHWFLENQEIRYYIAMTGDFEGKRSFLESNTMGAFDDIGAWFPRYKQPSVLEKLLRNEFSSIKPQEMYCLISIVGMADAFGIVNSTTIRKISDITGYSKDTTIRHIDSLKASKLIREKSKASKIKKKGILQEKLPRKYEVILGYEQDELDGVLFNELEDRMRK